MGFVPALSSAALAPAEAVDENAETAEIIGLLLKGRLAADGEEPDGTYLVVSAEYLLLCTPNDDKEYAASRGSPITHHRS